MQSRDWTDLSDDLLPFRGERNCHPSLLQEQLNALHQQGALMLLVHLDDYFDTVACYEVQTVAQRELKMWPDNMFRWVAAVLFTVLDRVDIQTLDYYLSIDNLRQVFRHLHWSNLLFNWKATPRLLVVASVVSPLGLELEERAWLKTRTVCLSSVSGVPIVLGVVSPGRTFGSG
ncbi:hypothetical protein MTO96_000301 [Rhipicephalus appendiculatus]